MALVISEEYKGKTLNDGTPIPPENFFFVNRPHSEEEISLFNDPRWKSARESMSAEQVEHYRKIGEQMNGSIDFTTGESTEIPIPKPVENSLSYIATALKSGLLPSELTEDEIALLEEMLGKSWFLEFGFEENDLNEGQPDKNGENGQNKTDSEDRNKEST